MVFLTLYDEMEEKRWMGRQAEKVEGYWQRIHDTGSPDEIIECLAELGAHADKNYRAEQFDKDPSFAFGPLI